MFEFAKMFNPTNLMNLQTTADRLSLVLRDIYTEIHELNVNLKAYNDRHPVEH